MKIVKIGVRPVTCKEDPAVGDETWWTWFVELDNGQTIEADAITPSKKLALSLAYESTLSPSGEIALRH